MIKLILDLDCHMFRYENLSLTFYTPSPFPSPPAYRQAGAGERVGVRGKKGGKR
jgi:hypothetical protein